MLSISYLFESATRRSLNFLKREHSKSPLLYNATSSLNNIRSIVKHGLMSPIKAAGLGIHPDLEDNNFAGQRRQNNLTKEDYENSSSVLGRYRALKANESKRIDIPTSPMSFKKLVNFSSNWISSNPTTLKEKRPSGIATNDDISASIGRPILSYGKQGSIFPSKLLKPYVVSTQNNEYDGKKDDDREVTIQPSRQRFYSRQSGFDKIDYPHVKPNAYFYTPSPDQDTRDFVKDLKDKNIQTIPLNKRTKKLMNKQLKQSFSRSDLNFNKEFGSD